MFRLIAKIYIYKTILAEFTHDKFCICLHLTKSGGLRDDFGSLEFELFDKETTSLYKIQAANPFFSSMFNLYQFPNGLS